jgi:hypothetical protein
MDKMKLKNFSLYFIFGALSAGGITIHTMWTVLSRITAYAIDIDATFSPLIQANIRDYVCNTPLFKTASLITINDSLKKKFPCIEHVTSERQAPGIAHIQIKTAKPLLSLNDSMILASDGSFVSKEVFTKAMMKKTIPIACSDLSTMTPALAPSLRFFLNPLLHSYTITWHNDHTTLLHDKQDPWFTVICNAQSAPSDATLIRCEQLKQKLIITKSNNNWIADVRFHNQIVVYKNNPSTGFSLRQGFDGHAGCLILNNKKKGATYG